MGGKQGSAPREPGGEVEMEAGERIYEYLMGDGSFHEESIPEEKTVVPGESPSEGMYRRETPEFRLRDLEHLVAGERIHGQ